MTWEQQWTKSLLIETDKNGGEVFPFSSFGIQVTDIYMALKSFDKLWSMYVICLYFILLCIDGSQLHIYEQ
jgi:hypothetical protein